jgi:hypothetical protein
MPRRFILTTATITALLAAGQALPAAGLPIPLPRPSRSSAQADRNAPPIDLLTVGRRHLAVLIDPEGSTEDALAVAIQTETATPPPAAIRLWIGIKNGWGSQRCKAEASTSHPGFLTASVRVPDMVTPSSRLWLAVLEPDGGEDKASLALPASMGGDHV